MENPIKLFKVLKDGRSCHGGNLEYNLPVQQADGTWQPGEWHETADPLDYCNVGFHLTAVPAEWWLDGCTVFVAESGGEAIDRGENKICCRKVRLLAVATDAELEAVQIFSTGTHTVTKGKVVARGNSSVVARGNSSVEAWGNSSVEAWGNSSVVARENSSVEARENSSVVARGNSTINSRSSRSKTKLLDYAILIDRTAVPPTVIASWAVEVKVATNPAESES